MHEITEIVTEWIGNYGLYAVFVLSVVDAVLPAASEIVMVYAGAVAVGAIPGHEVTFFGSTIDSTLWAFVAMSAAGTTGYLIGSVIGWAIGLYGGRPFLERHGRLLHVTPAKLDQAEGWFRRYGDVAVLVARMLPVIRSFISIPAGIAEMRLGRYTVLSAIGTIPWYVGLTAAGVAAGAGWERFHESWRYAEYAVAAVVAAGLVYVVARMLRRRVRRRAYGRSG